MNSDIRVVQTIGYELRLKVSSGEILIFFPGYTPARLTPTQARFLGRELMDMADEIRLEANVERVMAIAKAERGKNK